MPTLDPQVRDAAARWAADDIDPRTRSELQKVLAAATAHSAEAIAELTDRMSGLPSFGTAGLRSRIRAGANGMNRSVVVRTTAGVASWLRERGDGAGVVVVGYDVRHGSEVFATDTAAVFAAAGFDVRLLPGPLPTPILAHAARRLNAVAGVQITASHNPPQDNGYKLYLDGGIQLTSPADTEIEAAIAQVPSTISVPRKDSWTIQHRVLEDYLDRAATLPGGSSRDLRVVATALHGVGAGPLTQALHRAGFTDVRLVPSQAEPDPDFPTTGFPNPEEPGATDAVLELAREVEADLAIALDPDADRCAVGVPAHGGGWRMLSGDETGVLLGEHLMSTLDHSVHPDPLVATTIVSATMSRSIAAEHRVRYDETFTGFKWLVRAGDGRGTGLVYAYEEALGLCVDPEHVRDKDGISATLLTCDLAAAAKHAGQTLESKLDALAIEHGVHRTGQVSVRVTDLSMIPEAMRRLRRTPPDELAGTTVETRDLLPDTDAVVLTGPGGLRVVVRPSGTEPKLKCYLQVVEHVGESTLPEAKQRATDRLENLRTAVSALVTS